MATLRTIARQVRDLYEKVGLVPFVQATGSRGFHVVTPLGVPNRLSANRADDGPVSPPDATVSVLVDQPREELQLCRDVTAATGR